MQKEFPFMFSEFASDGRDDGFLINCLSGKNV